MSARDIYMHLMSRALLFLAALLAAGMPLQGAESPRAALADRIVAELKVKRGIGLDLGCGDARLAIEIARRTKLKVHCVDPDAKVVRAARKAIDDARIYGTRICAEQGRVGTLPYPTHCANLIICGDEFTGSRAGRNLGELFRVLNPNGVAYVGGRKLAREQLEGWLKDAGIASYRLIEQGGVWARITKPHEKGWDEWCHRSHDPANTYASDDRIGGPAMKLLWAADYQPGLASAAILAADGKLIEIGRGYNGHADTTPYIQVSDAFNGVRLWAKVGQKQVGIDRPLLHYSPLRSCSDVAAVGGRLYALGGKLCHALDLATGKEQAAWPIPPEAKPAAGDIWLYLAVIGDTVYGSIGKTPNHQLRGFSGWGGPHWRGMSTALFALDRRTGKLQWVHSGSVATASIVIGDGRVVFFDGQMALRALDLATGKEQWAVKTAIPPEGKITHAALYRGKVWAMYSPSGGVSSKTRDRGWKVAVFSAKDGALLHEPTPEEGAVASMTLSEGVVFMAPQHGQGRIQVVDAATGAFRNDLIPRVPGSKCTPLLATPNWLFYRHQAGSGFIRIDRKTKRMYTIHRIRCTCHYPGLPANGLLYVQGPGCNCAHAFRANVALIPGARTPVVPKDPDSRVVKGPAFGQPVGPVDKSAWATWRADHTRSGQTADSPALPLEQAWSEAPDGRLTPVAAAGGLVFCGSTARKFYALDATTGKPRWQYMTEGRIRVAPYCWQGKVYFGDDGGWVHCLRARDGALVWRYPAKLGNDRVVAYGDLMSAWPAGNGVLVHGGTAYFTAGFFPGDGGVLYAADANTGEIRWTKMRLTFRLQMGATAGPMALGKKFLFVPTVGGPPIRVPLESPAQISGPPRHWRGAFSARGRQVMTLGDEAIVGTRDMQYIHHVTTYHHLSCGLPVVTDDVIYYRDGRALTAEKRAAYTVHPKRGRFTWVDSQRPGHVVSSPNAEDTLWRAWQGVRMTAAIKAGGTIFSGGAGRVYATDAATGRSVWNGEVNGKVTDLAFNGGRLLVVTDAGSVACFGAANP